MTSLPPADLDVVDDGDANTDVTDTQSNENPRANTIDPSSSTSAQGIKLEPVFTTETAHVPANTSIDQAEAESPIPTEPVISGPNLNRTVAVRRKAAKRTNPLYITPPPPQTIPTPPLPPPQAHNIPVTQKPRVEEPLPTTTDEAAKNIAAPDISEGLPSPATPPPSTETVNAPTRRRSSRRVILTSSTDTPILPPCTANVETLTRRKSRRQTQFPPIETS